MSCVTSSKAPCCCVHECCQDLPDDIKVTITNIDPECACGNRAYVLSRIPNTNKWRGGGDFCDRAIEFTFCCGLPIAQDDPQCFYGMYLGVTWTPSCPSSIGDCDDLSGLPAGKECSCDPLLVSWTVGFTPLCCGQDDAAGAFIATITDV